MAGAGEDGALWTFFSACGDVFYSKRGSLLFVDQLMSVLQSRVTRHLSNKTDYRRLNIIEVIV